MDRYRVKIQTVKQYLTGRADYITVRAKNKYSADFKLMDIIKILESGLDSKSAYCIYSYEFI